ncbi:hypothetical protein [Aeromonas dhakensis]|uniref:hypothetical protein n=1 Tax=Aeromonas dhakensis TaxID=196024 RepID=UPI003CEE60F9
MSDNNTEELEHARERLLKERELLRKQMYAAEKRRFEREARQRRLFVTVSGVVAIAGLISSILVVGPFASSSAIKISEVQSQILFPVETENNKKLIKDINNKIKDLKDSQEKLQQLINEISNSPEDSKNKALVSRVLEIEKRITSLEAAILASPEKSLAVPILRKDIDNISEQTKSQVLDLKARIDQTYEIYKWLIGLLITVVIGVLGLVLNTWLGRDKPNNSFKADT